MIRPRSKPGTMGNFDSDRTAEPVRRVWTSVLGTQPRPDDNFFLLGGTSLSAVTAIRQLRVTTGRNVRLATLFQYPVFEVFVASLEMLPFLDNDPSSQTAVSTTWSLASPEQERRVLRDLADPSFPARSWIFGYALRGPLDSGRLLHAVNALARRHDALRTRFRVRADGAVEQSLAEIEIIVMTAETGDDPETEDRTVKEFAALPFDRPGGAVFRVLFMRRATDDWVLLFAADGICFDRTSVSILARDLSALYNAAPEEPSLPDLTQFARYGERERASAGSADDLWLRTFWRRYLDGSQPMKDYSLRNARWNSDAPAAAHRCSWRVPDPNRNRVEAFVRRVGTTTFAYAGAAMNLLMTAASGEVDHVFHTVVANRELPEFQETIGWFSHVTAIRTKLDTSMSLTEAFEATAAAVRDTMQHAELTWSEIIRECQPELYLSAPTQMTPLLNVMEPLQALLRLDGVSCRSYPVDARKSYADSNIALSLLTGPDRWSVSLTAPQRLLSASHTEKLVFAYGSAFTQLLDNPQRTLGSTCAEIADSLS
jgi:hypothetical protein